MSYIDGLPPASALSPTDLVPVDQGVDGKPGHATTRAATITQFLNAGPQASNALPLPNGTPTAGTSAAYSRGDHVHGGGGSGGGISDGLDVANYGGIYDGIDGALSITITANTTALTIAPVATCNITIAQGSNLLTIVSASNQFLYPAPEDVGKPIAVPGAGAAGGVLVTTIAAVTIAGSTTATLIQLADQAQTAVTNTSTSMTWPCFRPQDQGKPIWISCIGAVNPIGGTGSSQPLLTTIATYTSPTQVTLAATSGSGNAIGDANNNCALVVWGTDNTTAISNARQAAAPLSIRNLFYAAASNPAALCCAWNMSVNGPINDAVGNAIHLGAGVRSFWTDSVGIPVEKGIVPLSSPSPPPPRRRLKVSRDCPRFTAAANPVVVSWGDSMAVNGLTLSPSISQPTQIKNALIRNNRGKTITFYDRGIGSTELDHMVTAPPGPAFPTWYNDTSASWASYVSSLSPDLIILAENGGNDAQLLNPAALVALLNLILTTFPKDGSGRAPDIILLNNRSATLVNQPGFAATVSQDARERVSALFRSTATTRGLGFLDYHDQTMRVRQGWSPTRLALRLAGQAKSGIVSTVRPYGFGRPVRDVDCFYSFSAGGSTGGADTWTSWGTFTCQIGSQYGNNLILGLDGSSNLTCQVNTWGYTVSSSVSITSGAAVLTVAGAVTTPITSATLTTDPSTGGAILTVSGATPFSAGMVGQAIVVPTGSAGSSASIAHYGDFRSQIIAFTSNTTVVLADAPRVASVGAVSIITGPMLFHPNDAIGAINIVVPGAGAAGVPLVTTVATFTSNTNVTLTANAGTTLTASTQNVFLGRICVPKFSTTINPNTNLYSASQFIRVSRRAENLYVTCLQNPVTKSATVTIGSASPNLSTSAPVFAPGMAGWSITVPGAGAAGASLTTTIKTVTNSTAVVLNTNAATALSAQVKTLTLGGGPEDIVFQGPVEYFGGPFIPLVWPGVASPPQTPTAGPRLNLMSADYPVYSRPIVTDLELWGTSDQLSASGGNGLNHNTSLQSVLVDGPVIDAQDWSAT